MKKASVIIGLISVAGCQTTTTPSYQGVMKNYMACVIVHADEFAMTSREDPYYTALAARDACGKERSAAQDAVFAAERPSSRLRVWKVYDNGIIRDMTARITRKRIG